MAKKRKVNGNRRGPLTNEDKKYLDKNKHKSIEHLARMLKRSEIAITNYFNPKVEVVEPVNNSTSSVPEDTYLMTNFGRHNQGSGIVVMTKNAAEISDAIRKPKSNIPKEFIMNKNKGIK